MIFRPKRNEFFYYKKKPQKSVIFFWSKHSWTKKNELENEPNTESMELKYISFSSQFHVKLVKFFFKFYKPL